MSLSVRNPTTANWVTLPPELSCTPPSPPSQLFIYAHLWCICKSETHRPMRCGVSVFHRKTHHLLRWLHTLLYKWHPWESFNCRLHVNFIRLWQFICKRRRSPNTRWSYVTAEQLIKQNSRSRPNSLFPGARLFHNSVWAPCGSTRLERSSRASLCLGDL